MHALRKQQLMPLVGSSQAKAKVLAENASASLMFHDDRECHGGRPRQMPGGRHG